MSLLPSAASAPARNAGTAVLLSFAIAFGVAGAAAEIALLGAKQLILHRFIGVSWMMVWMTPLVNVALMTIVAASAMTYGAFSKRATAAIRAGLAAMAFLMVLSPLMLFSRLHPLAAALFSAGAALQLARFLTGRWETSVRVIRAALPVLVLAPAIAGAALHGSRWIAERRMLAQLPAPAEGTPNIILIILDTVRARSLSLFGAPRPTSPGLERIAADGASFRHAMATASWTLPSHASMLSGRLSRNIDGNQLVRLRGSYPTLAGTLGDAGYVTAGFVANLLYTGRESGIARDFIHYDDYPISLQEIARSSGLVRRMSTQRWIRDRLGIYQPLGRRDGRSVSDHFLDWLESPRTGDRPFFAFLNYFDAHAPYLPPSGIAERVGVSLRAEPLIVDQANVTAPPQDLVEAEMAAYEAAIAALDEELAWLFERLESLGRLDNTLFIVASDHGEEFAEHGSLGHGRSLYLPAVRVPLVMRFPGRIPAGTHVDQPITLADLPATILELVAVPEHGLPGTSFLRALYGVAAGRPAVSKEDEMRSVVAGDFHLLLDTDGRALQLFDRLADPLEQLDLSPDPKLQPVVECMLGLLDLPTQEGSRDCVPLTEAPPGG